MIAPLHWLC